MRDIALVLAGAVLLGLVAGLVAAAWLNGVN